MVEPLDFLEAKAFLPETRIQALAAKLNEVIEVVNALHERYYDHVHISSGGGGGTSGPRPKVHW